MRSCAGDTLISVTGKPYDTLHHVIGIGASQDTGSLADFGVKYRQVELPEDGNVDVEQVAAAIKSCRRAKTLFIQRSRGYAWRRALTIQNIRTFVQQIKQLYPDIIVIVDNCYGEFCEVEEPIEAGADLIAGSMIKNPGGGLAPTGGYIAGRADLYCIGREPPDLPGLGTRGGFIRSFLPPVFQGLFMAPHVVGGAQGSVLAAKVFEELGFRYFRAQRKEATSLSPYGWATNRCFCLHKGIQKAAAIDSHAVPVPWDMPGYDDPIVMAAGTFVQGASIELSAGRPGEAAVYCVCPGGAHYART